MIQMSETLGALSGALAEAQGSFDAVTKDKTATVQRGSDTQTRYRYTYADLAAIAEVIDPICAKVGLSVTQHLSMRDGETTLVSMLLHSSGEWLMSETPLVGKSTTPQGWGSLVTYTRRYAKCAILGIVVEDDDGSKANGEALANGGETTSRPSPRPRAAEPDARGSSPTTTAASKAQVGMIRSKLTALGMPEEDAHEYVAGLLASTFPEFAAEGSLASFNDLTKAQASKAIDLLLATAEGAR